MNRNNERGASLIEILVVMVVLVIGIFTVIRIFPVGFDLLQFAGNASVAHQFAEREVEYWRRNSENLPEEFQAIEPSAAGLLAPPVQPPRPNDFVSGTGAVGDVSSLRDDVRSVLERMYGAVSEDMVDRYVGPNRVRKVIGEVTRIPAPAPVDWGPDDMASVYSLVYAPIEWPSRGTPTSGEAERYIRITGNPRLRVDVTGMDGDSLATAVGRLRPREYGIDTGKGLLFFPRSSRPRQFVVDYTYAITAPEVVPAQTVQVKREWIVVPAIPAGAQVPIPANVGRLGAAVPGHANFSRSFRRVVPGSDAVAPKFRYLLPQTPFSDDPYEFKLLARFPLNVAFTSSIAFNPAGHNTREQGATGLQEPMAAKIDYIVKDWRILHQDVTLPESAPFRVRLPLANVKIAGQTAEENVLEPWTGLASIENRGLSVVAVDPASGDVATDDTIPGGFSVDARTGTLEFPSKLSMTTPGGRPRVLDANGRTLRVFFSVEGDWAVVPQKPSVNYRIRWVDRPMKPVVDQGTTWVLPYVICEETRNDSCGKRFVQILFPPSDEGMSVSADFTYRDNGDNGGRLKTLRGEELQVTSESRQSAGEPWYFKFNQADEYEQPRPYVKIYLPRDAAPGRWRGPEFASNFVLDRIQGTSFRAVTVWRDRSRWRTQAVTTYLVRKA